LRCEIQRVRLDQASTHSRDTTEPFPYIDFMAIGTDFCQMWRFMQLALWRLAL
jgi:hypothetical protein